MIQYDHHIWTDHLFSLKGSVVQQIATRVLVFGALSAGVVALFQHVPAVAVPATVHSLLGTALGLLLVMRTNSSYDRFWEGRKQWGAIVNETRNLARAASVLLGDDPALVKAISRWTAAFTWATMHRLRGHRGLGPVAALLTPAEVEDALAQPHPPLFIARRLTALIDGAKRKGLVSDIQQATLDANVQQLIDYMGACERIQKTPLPFAYAVHLRRALIAFCITLPFAIVKEFGWDTVPATLLVSFVFFGIEEIGVEIENPFGTDENDLPLEAICETIQGNVLALAGDALPPQPRPPA